MRVSHKLEKGPLQGSASLTFYPCNACRQANGRWQVDRLIEEVDEALSSGHLDADPNCMPCVPEHADELAHIALRYAPCWDLPMSLSLKTSLGHQLLDIICYIHSIYVGLHQTFDTLLELLQHVHALTFRHMP